MTTTNTSDGVTADVTCACGCAPSMSAAADTTDAVAETPSGCSCSSGDTAGCGPDCACGTTS